MVFDYSSSLNLSSELFYPFTCLLCKNLQPYIRKDVGLFPFGFILMDLVDQMDSHTTIST
jgi:hypothetical protein